jgi:hypothetical protein
MEINMMRAVATERWTAKRELEVRNWLTECAGPSTMDTWFVDYDYNLISLIMTEELYTMYRLRYDYEKV